MNKFPVEIFYTVVFGGKFSAGKVKMKKQNCSSFEIEIMSIFHSRILVYPDDFDCVFVGSHAKYDDYFVFSDSLARAIAILKRKIVSELLSCIDKCRMLDEAMLDIVEKESSSNPEFLSMRKDYVQSMRTLDSCYIGSSLSRLELFSPAETKILLHEFEAMPEATLTALGIPYMSKSNVDEAVGFARAIINARNT